MAHSRSRRWQQRAITWPAILLGAPLLLILSPILFAVTIIADLLTGPRRMRWTRLLAMGMHYVLLGWLGLAAGGALWVATGFGLFMGRPWARRPWSPRKSSIPVANDARSSRTSRRSAARGR